MGPPVPNRRPHRSGPTNTRRRRSLMLTDPESTVADFSTVFSLPVPAYSGRAVSVAAGTTIRITDVQGHQIGDLFAFVRDRPTEWLSVGATRTAHTRLFPEIG